MDNSWYDRAMITSSPPKVLVHPSFLRLEEELASRIRGLRESGPSLIPILVVAPSERMVRRVREALAGHLGAVAGVECLNYQALAYRILDHGSEGRALLTASAPLLETLVQRLLAREPDSSLTRYGRSRPGAVRALARLLVELRESGLESKALEEEGPPAIASLFRAYETAMAGLTEAGSGLPGWGDRSEIFRTATRRAPELPPFEAVFAYGAYELVGINLDLLQAIPSREGITYLIPADPKAPAWSYARDFIGRHLETPVEVLPDNEPTPFTDVARSFWKPGVQVAISKDRLSRIDVQGPEAELNVAARLALRWIDSEVPPWEIGIVARTLDPYLPLAESVFERHQLPVDTSLSLPLSRLPAIRAFLLLLRILGRDFERQPVIELVRSPLFRRPDLSEPDRSGWRPGSWDQWSRAYGITRGAESWTEMLPQLVEAQIPPPWVQEDAEARQNFDTRRAAEAESARVLARVIERLVEERERWTRCRSGEEHRQFLEGLGGRWIREAAEAAFSSWLTALAELEGLQALRSAEGSSQELDTRMVQEFVERALEEAKVPWKHPNGIGFLDFRQARGLSFRHLIVIGFNDGSVPNRPRELPFFPDETRERLREKTGKPLPLRRESVEEERLLFAQTVSAARESLTVIWQRADAEGKARAPSPYLRELRRLFPGPDSPGPVSVPTHPARNAEWLRQQTGLLTREEASVLAAEASRQDPVAGVQRVLGELDPDLAEELIPSFALIRGIERFESPDLSYDGWVSGEDVGTPIFSASGLKNLGDCPQTYFFKYVLGIKPLRDVTKDYRLDARDLGTHVHALLERVYSDLSARGFLNGGTDAATLQEEGKKSLEKHWKAWIDSLGRKVRQRFPFLFECTQEIWRKEAEAFLAKDLDRMAGGGYSDFSFETPWQIEIHAPLGSGETVALNLTGIADRVCRSGTGNWLISDYKTGGKPEKWIQPIKMLRLEQVQLPLYVLLAEATGKTGADAEVLGLGPSFFPDRGFVRDEAVVLDHEIYRKFRTSFLESLAVLGGMALEGKFPFQPDFFHCSWCEFASACRKNHYASQKRVMSDPRYEDYYLVQAKTQNKNSLAKLREAT